MGPSARAIDNIGALLYGVGGSAYAEVNFKSRADQFKMSLPMVHSVLLNRSTEYNRKASKAFAAMFAEIKTRTTSLKDDCPAQFVSGEVNFQEVPDAHSVAIVCSHLGRPLYSLRPGQYEVHDTHPQVNSEPLDRYKSAISKLVHDI